MREHRYRAWDRKYKRMGKVIALGFLSNDAIVSFGNEGDAPALKIGEQCDLMEYIGVKDICEDDIVKYDKYKIGKSILSVTPAIGVVEYGDGEFCINEIVSGEVTYAKGVMRPDEEYKDYYDFYGYDGDRFSWDEIEVIGNKHQNPEMMKGVVQ